MIDTTKYAYCNNLDNLILLWKAALTKVNNIKNILKLSKKYN